MIKKAYVSNLLLSIKAILTYLLNQGVPALCVEELLSEDTDLTCTVEHLICTRPTGDSRPAPLLGATVSYLPAIIISLRANHTLHTLKVDSLFRDSLYL